MHNTETIFRCHLFRIGYVSTPFIKIVPNWEVWNVSRTKCFPFHGMAWHDITITNLFHCSSKLIGQWNAFPLMTLLIDLHNFWEDSPKDSIVLNKKHRRNDVKCLLKTMYKWCNLYCVFEHFFRGAKKILI